LIHPVMGLLFEEISTVHFAIHDVRWRGRAHKKGSVVSIPFQFPCERELYLVLGTNPGPGSAVRQRKSRNSPTVYAAVEWLFDELDFFCHPACDSISWVGGVYCKATPRRVVCEHGNFIRWIWNRLHGEKNGVPRWPPLARE